MRRIMFLAAFAVVASLVLTPAAVGQEEEIVGEQIEQQAEQKGVDPGTAEVIGETVEQKLEAKEDPKVEAKEEPKEEAIEKAIEKQAAGKKKEMPKTGGFLVDSAVLGVAALLIGSGILGFAILRRR